MIDVFTKVVFAGACLFTFAWVILAQRRTIKRLSDAYLRLTHFQRVLVALAVIVCTVYAQKPSTNDVEGVSGTNEVEIVEGGETNEVEGIVLNAPQPMSNGASFFGGCGALGTVRPTVAVRPYRLESVSTNGGYSYALPADGTIRGTWYLTGAYEDVQKVALDDFRFPLGNDLCDSLWAYTWGKVRPQLKNASNEIAAVGAPMSAIPVVSRFWTAATSNDTYLLTWENFAAGRARSGEDAASPFLSAQIELFRNGDFIARSNDVECLYRRVIEPNPINPINPPDPDDPSMPLYPYGPVQDLSVIGETNAYCWVDIVVNTADAWVRFEGDGASNLADPSFAAKAGETNHVVILIGKTYKVTCDMPFTVVGKSDPSIDEWWEDGNTLWLNWPVDIWAWGDDEDMLLLLMGTGSGMSGGSGFTMRVRPSGLGGEFLWTNSCCSVSGSGLHFSYGCDGFCLCGGCSARGYYGYEGYRIGCSGGSCGCSWYDDDDRHGEDDPEDPEPTPGVSVSFSKSAVIFEDEYTNMPGRVVQWQSTTTKLTLEAHGGMKGGTATFTFTNKEKLIGPDIPTSITVPAGHCKTYEFTYRGNLPSGSEEDITVHGEFQENNPEAGSQPLTSDDELTSVKVLVYSAVEAPGNRSRYRRTYGIAEIINCLNEPSLSKVRWSAVGAGAFVGANTYSCPYYETGCGLRISLGNAYYDCEISVIEPDEVVCDDATMIDYSTPKGTAGYFGMELSGITLLPLTVSFGNLYVEEIPTDVGVRTGYFSDPLFSDCWSHSYAQGAGIWIGVDGNNALDIVDRATCGAVPPPWSNGGMIWPIPMGFHTEQVPLGSPPIGEIDANVSSIYTVMPSGSVILSKLGHWISRSTNDVIVVDGVVVKGEE